MNRGEQALAVARAWIGTPYVHQASTQFAGCDCLGLLRGVWRSLYGAEPEDMPAYSADWSEASGNERLWAAAIRHLEPVEGPEAPGDVLLFRMRQASVAKHLGLLGNATSFVHAYTHHGVIESPLGAPWRRRIVARFRFPERVN